MRFKFISNYDNFLNEEKISKGCLMLFFSFDNWKNFVENYIDSVDIYDDESKNYGYEYEPHCTILFGLHHYADIEKDIVKYLPDIKTLDDISYGNVSIFENEDFDVVKFSIQSKKLHDLNKILCNNFKYTNDYDGYEPHMTIAYVKKGLGKKYVKENKSQFILGNKYVYSDPEYNKKVL